LVITTSRGLIPRSDSRDLTMDDAAAFKHDYHLVKPSPWPLLGSLAMLVMVFGTAGFLKGLWFIPKGAWWGPVPGFIALVFVLIGWWGDVLKESRAGDHKEVVQISL